MTLSSSINLRFLCTNTFSGIEMKSMEEMFDEISFGLSTVVGEVLAAMMKSNVLLNI